MDNVLAIVPKEPVPRPTLPEDWNYQEANKDFDKNIRAWRKLTDDVLLHAFYFYLFYSIKSRDKQGRFTSVSNVTLESQTWEEWCEAKATSRMTFCGRYST